jgi:CheY-like chemotaxis protein
MPQYEQQDVTSSPAKLRNRILVIDDGDSVRNIIGVFLEHAGFAVCGEAADGIEGIEQAKKTEAGLDRVGFGYAPDGWNGSCANSP